MSDGGEPKSRRRRRNCFRNWKAKVADKQRQKMYTSNEPVGDQCLLYTAQEKHWHFPHTSPLPTQDACIFKMPLIFFPPQNPQTEFSFFSPFPLNACARPDVNSAHVEEWIVLCKRWPKFLCICVFGRLSSQFFSTVLSLA